MENNDILIRLRYALDIKNTDMVKIFGLGGVEVSKDEVLQMLQKPKDYMEEEDDSLLKCNDRKLESFLNGLIVFKRGKQDPKPGQPEFPPPSKESVNNLLFKKVKIALALTSDDILGMMEDAGVNMSKGELGAILRKEGQKNYKECGDKFARNFLKGLTMRYRE
ncbi:YehS family protein [Bacillus massilinigeriensis]|uniref:DUF1456 family protein n=1 Tax=Bacillus mediterraneensis TaxID=1805474 RepID=UPI0008F93F7D|nr:DUF1456 family protein [Bacillus mediterraneensis]